MLVGSSDGGTAPDRGWSIKDLVAPADRGTRRHRAKVRAAMTWTAAASALLTAGWTPDPTPVLIWGVAAAVLGVFALIEPLDRFWDRFGGLTAIAMIAVLVSHSGDAHSPYQVLFLVNAVFGAFYYPRRRHALETVVTTVVLLSPLVVPGPDDQNALAELLLRGIAYTSVAWFVHVLVNQLRSATVQLSVNEQRYRSLFTDNPDPVWSVDRDGRFTSVNEAGVQLTGWSDVELVGRHFTDLIPPEETVESRASFSAALHGRRTATRRTVLTRSGDRRILEVSAVPIHVDGDVVGAFGVGKDVTDRLRMEEALSRREAEAREAADRLEALIAASPMAVIEMDLEGRVTRWNGAAERTFGWSEEEALGSPLPFVTDEQSSSHLGLRGQVLGGGLVVDETVTRTRRDGKLIDLAVYAAPRFDADGEVAGIVAFSVDLTDQIRLRDELRQAQKMEAVGRLAGGVAHDFNNILTVILGSAELLLHGLPEDDPRQVDAVEIQEAAQRGADMVRRLLHASPQERGRAREVDLRRLVHAELDLLERTLGAERTLELVLPNRPVTVRIDPADVERILLNLAVNARDATGAEGTVTIELEAVGRSEAVLAIQDDGMGMDRDTLDRIFDPFFTTKPTGKGVGLGLSTVYGIVERSGGSVHVSSEPGQGTRLEVRLPLSDGTEPVDGEGSGRGVIMTVDDESAVRQLTARMLRRAGYEVVEAAGSGEALAMAEELAEQLGLLVTDVVMPGLEGPDLAERIRDVKPGLPVVYMSGYASSRSRGELEGPAERFLSKPIPREDLLRVVAELMAPTDATVPGKR